MNLKRRNFCEQMQFNVPKIYRFLDEATCSSRKTIFFSLDLWRLKYSTLNLRRPGFQFEKCEKMCLLTLSSLTTTIGVVPHRQTLSVAFYIFIQQIYVLNILNMVYTLSYFLFKMQVVS